MTIVVCGTVLTKNEVGQCRRYGVSVSSEFSSHYVSVENLMHSQL